MKPRKNECKLLGPVSIAIQLLMGVIVVSSLLLKRQSERPRRTWRVWCFDVGKQILGAVSIHFMNLLLSVLKGGGLYEILLGKDNDGSYTGDECDWYFLNLLVDTTVGIPILWCCLTFYESILKRMGVKNIESGNYFAELDIPTPNRRREPSLAAFTKQLAVFIVGLISMKCCLFLILLYFENVAEWFANWVLGWSDPWPNLQLFLVMFVFPLLLNCFQCFCVDSIIKLPSNRINIRNADNFDQEPLIIGNRPPFFSVSDSNKIYGSTA